MSAHSNAALPVTDLAPFFHGTAGDKRAVAASVARSCEEIGFLVIKGHGLPQSTIDNAIRLGFAFFDLPIETKNRWHPTGPAKQRGFHGMETRGLASTLDKDAPKDLRESVFLGPIDDHRTHYADIPEATTAYAPNLIPTEPALFDASLVEIYRGFEQLASDLMRIFAVALDQPEDSFAPLINRHFSILSVHHYPALSAPPKPGQLRTGAHTDYGSLTSLAMTEANGGLKAKAPDGRWIPVQAARGELVVNLGDMMQRWTNDRWVSTMHRVVAPDELDDAASRRMSIGYFMHPNYDAEIACIPSCLGAGESAKYAPITAGGHIRDKIEKSHAGAKKS
ncbi:MAG: 2-oxoglutarate and iron-dependent oxygenase domain-containing protein [Pseudomonadota bacterium]